MENQPHADPTPAEESPPGQQKARPPATKDEHTDSNPQIELCKAWLRASPQARLELLRDVKAAHPALWQLATEGTEP